MGLLESGDALYVSLARTSRRDAAVRLQAALQAVLEETAQGQRQNATLRRQISRLDVAIDRRAEERSLAVDELRRCACTPRGAASLSLAVPQIEKRVRHLEHALRDKRNEVRKIASKPHATVRRPSAGVLCSPRPARVLASPLHASG
ncbi:hypothetical protein M885DRAFT_524504 [Pelagophyceae sp. CCMP2097]|nr:hypothetical protein M885DRAFT_524504 [Pelagophyceae sp. CCMP2097]